jgi:hypothetical protein
MTYQLIVTAVSPMLVVGYASITLCLALVVTAAVKS